MLFELLVTGGALSRHPLSEQDNLPLASSVSGDNQDLPLYRWPSVAMDIFAELEA